MKGDEGWRLQSERCLSAEGLSPPSYCHGIPDDKGANIAAMKPLPKVAIASLGNLKWMFASGRRAVDIYSKMGIKAYSTNLHGDVSVFTDGRVIDVSTDSTKLYPEK